MLRKFSRSFERRRDGKIGMKFRFDIHVKKVVGAFLCTEPLRVVWNRGSKVQVTPSASITSSCANFNVLLSQVATLYKDSKNKLEEKEYTFKLQTVPSGTATGGRTSTIGKAQLELAQYASTDSTKRTVILPLVSSNPQIAKGLELHLEISTAVLKGIPTDDGLSGVSGISTVTTNSLCETPAADQDLTGFDAMECRTLSGKIGALAVVPSTELAPSVSQESDKTSVLSSNNSVPGEISILQTKLKDLENELSKTRDEKEETKRLLENFKRQSENDVAFLKRELESEKAQKTELENQLVKEMDELTGEVDLEEAIQSAIAPYELKYNALVDDYKQLMHQSTTDIDGLQEEVLDLRDHVAKLETLLETNERAKETLACEKRALEMSLIGSSTAQLDLDTERRELRQELTHVEEMMQDLIQTKINYAELSEINTISRREVYRLREKNLKLASKLTKIETYFYHQGKTA
eukprot:g2363.t1